MEKTESQETTDRAKFMARYKIRDIVEADDGWEVLSTSGKTYTVTTKTCIGEMGSMFFTWQCDCPARKRCRHIDAAEQYRYLHSVANGDIEDLDMLEMIH